MNYLDEKSARKVVLEASIRLLESGLVERTWGNVSMRISSDKFLITPSGRSYEDMKEEDLSLVSISDLSYSGKYKPSSEKGMHSEIYKVRDDATFIIHTHQTYASILSIKGKDFDIYPCAHYALSSTKALATSVANAFKNKEAKVVLMPHHGVVSIGKDPAEAFDNAITLESKAKEEVMKKVSSEVKGEDIGRSKRVKDGFILSYNGQERVCSFDDDSFPPSLHARIYTSYPLINFIASEDSNYSAAVSSFKETISPNIDDATMIAGRTIRYSDYHSCIKKLKNRNAIYLPSSALVISSEEGDIDALLSLVKKNSIAELYRRAVKAKSVPAFSAFLERFVYLKKYSKRKN